MSDLSSPILDTPEDNPDYARRFGGVARLYGNDALTRFTAARVAVIGVGGVGSWVVEALARTAVGGLTLIDLDQVAESNTNRQAHALNGNYGRAKVEAMAERVRLINPACRIDVIDDFISPDNFDALLGKEKGAEERDLPGRFDYVVDAIDNTRVKTALIAWCAQRKQKLITVGSAGGQMDPTRIRVDDLSRTLQDPLLAKVRQQLRRAHGFSKNLKTRFGIAAVYSDEPLLYPENPTCDVGDAPTLQGDGAGGEAITSTADAAGPAGLNCAGFGSSMCVTAGFGLAAAAHVLRELAAST